jgi:transketolase
LTRESIADLEKIAKEVRKDILFEVYNANSGHVGGALSCADILVAIYFNLINEGDKIVLSKGHASAALYAVLAEKGFFPKEELATFRKINSRLQGHPSYVKTPGIDASSGSLGQGLSVANGIALSFKLDKKSNHVYAILGDGEIQEGQIWEALMTANHYKLNNLIAFLDYNKLQIDGTNEEVMKVAPVKEKFEAFGFFVQEIDGHDFEKIILAVKNAKKQSKPSIIIANTIKGKGVSFMENKCEWHGKAPKKEEYEIAISELEK